MEGGSSTSTEEVFHKKRRIVLTGASGYLGQHLLYHWMIEQEDDDGNSFETDQQELWEIYALYSSMTGFEQIVKEKTAIHHQDGQYPRRRANVQVFVESLDLTNETAVINWISSHLPLDVCIHTAAISNPGLCEEQPDLAQAVNVPKHFLQALADHAVPIVALSTDQVFDGTKPTAGPLSYYTEHDAPNPINQYGKTKAALEEFLQTTSPQSHILLRSSIILGPLAPFGNAHSTFLHFCSSRENQETEFFTDECRTVVSIRNVVEVLLYFAQHPPNGETKTSGIYHMGGKDRVSRYDMAKYTFEHFNFDTKYLMPTLKAKLPPGKVKNPLDISMDSTKLANFLNKDSWLGINEILKDTFVDKPKWESPWISTHSC